MREKLNRLSRTPDTPGFPSAEARRRRLLNLMLLATAAGGIFLLAVLLIVASLGLPVQPGDMRLLGLGAAAALLGAGILYAINRYASVDLAAALLILLMVALAAFSDAPREVVNGRGLLTFALPILAASVLLRPWASFVAAAVSSLVVVIVGMLVVQQPVPNLPVIAVFFLLALVSWMATRSLERALENLRASNELLRETEERYRRLVEDVREVIYSVDSRGIITYISPAIEALTGYAVQDVIGESFAAFIDPEDLPRARERFEDVARGEEEPLEYRIVTRDGDVRWVRSHSHPSFSDGTFEGVRGVLIDVTERRRAAEALRASEARFRAIFEDAGVGMALADGQGRLTANNAALQEILGYTDAELQGMRFTELTHPEDRDVERRLFRELMRGERDVYRMEKRYHCKRGRVIWGRVTVSLVRDEAGEPLFAVGMLEDVTERKRAQHALRERVKELTCLHAVSSDMQKDLSVEELCQRVVEHLVPAMQFPEITAAVIDLDGRRCTAGQVTDGCLVGRPGTTRRGGGPHTTPSLCADVTARGETRGQVCIVYTEERPFLVPEEQDLLNSIAEALGRRLERKRAREDIRRQLRYNEALLEISRAISSTLDLDQVLDLVLDELQEVLPYDSASVFLLSDGITRLVAAKGHPEPEQARRVEFPVEDDALTRAMLGREHPLVLGDAQADERFRDRGGADYVRSWIGVPLIAKGEAVGLMTIDHRDAGAYDQTSAARAEAFARQAAVAIDNARLFKQTRQEIAQRRRTEEALERQLERVNLLNEIARAVTARHDLDSILRVVTQRLEESFSDQASVWLREGDSDVFTLASAGDRSREAVSRSGLPRRMTVPPEVPEVLSRGESDYTADLALLDVPALEHLDVRSAVAAPMAANGTLLGMIVSARREVDAFSQEERDFLRSLALHVGLAVHQARLHQDLREAYDDLRRTQRAMMRQERLRALGEMASGIAHDINNAISPVPLYTSLIEAEADLNEGAAAHLHAIETAISDVEETVARMRRFYRERGEEDLAPLDLNQAVRQAIRLTRPRWRDVPQEQGITIDLQTELQDDLPPLMGLEGEIRQAVTNLIFNAVDAMPKGGTLTLRTRRRTGPPADVILEVIDTGVGMDEETQERCFEPFFSTKGERGSGMGLAMVYGTMQRHGGDVQVESTPGEGTTMRLLFPIREIVEEGRVEEPIAPASSLRILCIDDEPPLLEALRGALEGEGHAVEVAGGGASGLEAFRAALERDEPFDVVITDLGMPDVSGRQVARTVKREAPETPVILLTGWGRRLSAEQDIPAAVDLMLGKPPTIDALNRALAQVAAPER